VILNPWVWVGLLLWTALAAGSGYWKGHKSAQDAAGAAHARELAAAIKEGQDNALIDAEAAFEAAESRQKTKVEYKDRIVTVEKVLNANPQKPECAIPDDSVRLLNDAIRAANHSTPAAERAIVPAPATAK